MLRKMLLLVIMLMAACSTKNNNNDGFDAVSKEVNYGVNILPLTGTDFKVPLPQGYDWEITQSWGPHCAKCDQKYPSNNSFCDTSHNVINYAEYGWDFSLPGSDDLGKSVLAAGDGQVKDLGYSAAGWGNWVLLDHGNNICTRYSHMLDASVRVVKDQEVCQGLKIGEIGMSGKAGGPHLHYQFEDCETHLPLQMAFTDGNEVPECVIGNDIYTDGLYTALKLNNVEKSDCSAEDLDPNKPQVPLEKPSVCGMQCPLNQDCANKGENPFSDMEGMESSSAWAIDYLWHECAVSGKADGDFHSNVTLTRAEALKIALLTFGLTKGCEGTTEPFGDVNPLDWFYPYVVCGVKYGIVSTTYNGFKPNDEVYFSEAAKMAVEAAVKSDKREMKTGTYANFPKLGIMHWAYGYLQTLAFYNGIEKDLLQKDPYDIVTRGEYSRMVASLSPCYCAVNECGSGCECDLSKYICKSAVLSGDSPPKGGEVAGNGTSDSDVSEFSASTGGKDAGSSEPEVAEEPKPEEPSCVPYCYKKECGGDGCGGSCGTCQKDMLCDVGPGKCFYQCNLPKSCAEIGCDCGNCQVPGLGCEKTTLACGSCAAGKQCNSGKCQVDPCYKCPPGQCVGGQCVIASGKCDPAVGYNIYVNVASGIWESDVSPSGENYKGYIPGSIGLHYKCSELPATLLISNLSGSGVVWLDDQSLPPFALWWPYSGKIPFPSPSYKPDLVAKSFPFNASSVLIRIPYN